MRVIVLHGDDDFLLMEYSRKLRTCLEETYGEIELFQFDGKETSTSMVLDELRSYGLLQTHKLVMLDRADEFMKRQENREALERYASEPMAEATLLIRASGWNANFRLNKIVAKHGTVGKCDHPSNETAISWCRRRSSKEYGVEIAPNAAMLLVEQIGSSLARLDTELSKLAVSLSPGKPDAPARIERADVLAMVGLSREE